MANGFPITPGVGGTVATDQLATGEHAQLVKLMAGEEDSAERIGGSVANGIHVDVTRVQGLVEFFADDGAFVTLGARADAAYVSGSGSVISVLKALFARLGDGTTKALLRSAAKGATTAADVTSTAASANRQPLDVTLYDTAGNPVVGGGAATIANGADVTQGAIADTTWAGTGSGTVIAVLKAIWDRLGSITFSGEDHIGQVGGHSLPYRPVITLANPGAYIDGDVIGGKLTLTNAMRITNGSGILQSVDLVDLSNSKIPLDIIVFDADVTIPADNAAFTWTAADFAKKLGVVHFAAGDWDTIGGEGMATKPGIGITLKANGTQNLYAAIVARAGATFAAGDIKAAIGILQD